MNVDIYTSKTCGYCVAAKQLLKSKGIDYREIDLTHDQDLRVKISNLTGHRTVPQIFIDKNFIGGFTELNQHLARH